MRKLIAAVVCALVLTASADARFPRGGSSASVVTTNGSPFVVITPGSISGNIVSSRDSDGSTYRTPFFVQVSASGITATGTSAPFEDLGYSWNFGEGCSDTFVRPTDGATVCSGTDQRGPMAAYVYRTSGTKTVTLTVTGSNGVCGAPNTPTAGICQTVTPYVVTKQFVVNAFPANDKYVKAGSCVTSCAGTFADPYNSIAQVNSNIASNTAFHFCRGDVFNDTSQLDINPGAALSSLRFDAAFAGCSGANPKIDVTSGTDGALHVSNGGSSSPGPLNDIVFSNIDFSKSGGTPSVQNSGAVNVTNGNSTATSQNIYFDNLNVSATYVLGSGYAQVFGLPTPPTPPTYLNSGFGLWNVTVTNPLNNSVAYAIGVDGSAQTWHFQIGGSIAGAGENSGADHHIYNDVKFYGLYQWIDCGPTGTGAGKRSYCFNGNWDGERGNPADHQIAQYHAFIENNCKYTSFCIDLDNAQNNAGVGDSTTQFQYVVIAGNAYQDMTGDIWGAGLSVTNRDNRFWNSSSATDGRFYAPANNQIPGYTQGANLLGKVYRNSIYIGSAVGTVMPPGSAQAIYYDTTNPWTAVQKVGYNKIVDNRATAMMATIPWSDWITAGSTFDFNTYYAQAAGTSASFMADSGTPKTFNNWQNAATTPARWDVSGLNLSSNITGWTLPVTQWVHMNFLLKRDLDPASNDNDPMWLEKAA